MESKFTQPASILNPRRIAYSANRIEVAKFTQVVHIILAMWNIILLETHRQLSRS